MDHASYIRSAAPLSVLLAGQTLSAKPKVFKTGSSGWYLGGKVDVDGVRCQLSMSLVIVGSKPLRESSNGEQTTPMPIAAPQKPAKAPRKKRQKATASPPPSPTEASEAVVQMVLDDGSALIELPASF